MKHLILTTAMITALAITGCSNKTSEPTLPTGDAVLTATLPDANLAPQAWFAENAKRPEVITRPSGLQYAVIKSGDKGQDSPTPGQMVTVHYEGKLTDGTKFDSSYDRGEPAQFPSDALVPGWVEALQIMVPGDEWMLYVSPELGYGPNGRPPVIPANSIMVFRMELLDVMDSPIVINGRASAAWLEGNGQREGVVTTDSGLQYSVLKSGSDDGVSPTPGQMVTVHYEGKLTDGTVFDSSYERGQPATFPSDQLVPGWVEALQIMKPGDEWELYVSPELGYGVAGRPPRIPQNSVMVFRMELLDVEK